MNQNDYPKIPEGKYPAIYVGFKKSRWITQDKLYLEFEIVEEPFKGKRLVHYYNVHFSPDRDRVGAGFMSNFLRDYARLFGVLPERLDRISLDVFKDQNYTIYVHDNTKMFQQNDKYGTKRPVRRQVMVPVYEWLAVFVIWFSFCVQQGTAAVGTLKLTLGSRERLRFYDCYGT